MAKDVPVAVAPREIWVYSSGDTPIRQLPDLILVLIFINYYL
jgi:hypothetical protein